MTKKKINDKKLMFRKLLLSIIVLAISLSYGCGGPVDGGSNSRIYVGTKGVTVEFFSSNPKSIFENDDFALAFFLKNEGTYTLNGTNTGSFIVTYDEYYLKLNGSRFETITLEGRSLTNPEGEDEYFEFLFDAKSLNNLRESIKTKINFNMCYPYRTEASTAVCVDTRINNNNDQNNVACKSKIYTSSQGQGGPITVTKIEPEMMIYNRQLVRPQYKITIENKGKGYVINRPNENERVCDNINLNRTSPNLKKITVRAYLSNQPLNCDPAELRMQDGQDNFVRCAVKDEYVGNYSRTNRNYVAPLTVVIDYGYVEVVPYDIEIKRRFEVDVPEIACGYYEVLQNNSCVSKCEFCAKNPGDSMCKIPLNAPASFKWTNGFSCSCSKTRCNELDDKGECIFGFCPGSEYCCKTYACQGQSDGASCGDNFVCIGKQCSTMTECAFAHNTTFSNYTCTNISGCQDTVEYPIKKGLCPGAIDWVCCLPKNRNGP